MDIDELVCELRAKATARFLEFGSDDCRGAAIWDVADWLSERVAAHAV